MAFVRVLQRRSNALFFLFIYSFFGFLFSPSFLIPETSDFINKHKKSNGYDLQWANHTGHFNSK